MLKLSNKQLKMFGTAERKPGALDGCPRKWGYQYLDKFPAELGQALVDGIKHHAVLASLVKHGRMPEPAVLQPGVVLSLDDVRPEGHFGKLARCSLPLLPVKVPEVIWQAEQSYVIEWVTANGTRVTLDVKPDVHTPFDCRFTDLYLVDWKSCAGRKWALKTLADDVQANLYAYGLCLLSNQPRIDAVWIYVDKKTYDAWRLCQVFLFDKVAAWLHANIDRTIDMLVMLREQTPEGCQLPRDLGACEGTGKFCDYAGKCFSNKTTPIIRLDEIRAFIERKAA